MLVPSVDVDIGDELYLTSNLIFVVGNEPLYDARTP